MVSNKWSKNGNIGIATKRKNRDNMQTDVIEEIEQAIYSGKLTPIHGMPSPMLAMVNKKQYRKCCKFLRTARGRYYMLAYLAECANQKQKPNCPAAIKKLNLDERR